MHATGMVLRMSALDVRSLPLTTRVDVVCVAHRLAATWRTRP
jgi:hypothetical protein